MKENDAYDEEEFKRMKLYEPAIRGLFTVDEMYYLYGEKREV